MAKKDKDTPGVEAVAPVAAEKTEFYFRATGRHPLRDPFQNITFVDHEVRGPAKKTGWVQAQLDAGLLREE